VPSRLEAVSAFDIIGKSCSLSEGVFILASGQRSMGFLECAQFSESSSEDIGVGLFKDDLGFSGNKNVRSAPVSFNGLNSNGGSNSDNRGKLASHL